LVWHAKRWQIRVAHRGSRKDAKTQRDRICTLRDRGFAWLMGALDQVITEIILTQRDGVMEDSQGSYGFHAKTPRGSRFKGQFVNHTESVRTQRFDTLMGVSGISLPLVIPTNGRNLFTPTPILTSDV
jgi:hypothetical protein